jgi:hypothetical protein
MNKYILLAFAFWLPSNYSFSQIRTFDDTQIDYPIKKDLNLNVRDYRQRSINREKLTQFLFNITGEIDWLGVEKQLDFDKKKEIILALGREDFYNNQLFTAYGEAYARNYHLIDLNNNGKLDVIYNAADGADTDLILIWKNTEDGYKRVFSQTGVIKNLEIFENEIIIIVDNFPFSDRYYGKIQKFSISNNSAILTKEYRYMDNIILPPEFYDIYDFKTINENYNLRTSPRIINEPCDEYPDGKLYCGNIATELKSGTKGKAIFAYQDENERIWWFSILKFDDNISELGWISSRFVKPIDEK